MPDRVAGQKNACLSFMSPVKSTVLPFDRRRWMALSSRLSDFARQCPAGPWTSVGLWVFMIQNGLPVDFALSCTSGMLTRLPWKYHIGTDVFFTSVKYAFR